MEKKALVPDSACRIAKMELSARQKNDNVPGVDEITKTNENIQGNEPREFPKSFILQ